MESNSGVIADAVQLRVRLRHCGSPARVTGASVVMVTIRSDANATVEGAAARCTQRAVIATLVHDFVYWRARGLDFTQQLPHVKTLIERVIWIGDCNSNSEINVNSSLTALCAVQHRSVGHLTS